jgi:hypothetical protein
VIARLLNRDVPVTIVGDEDHAVDLDPLVLHAGNQAFEVLCGRGDVLVASDQHIGRGVSHHALLHFRAWTCFVVRASLKRRRHRRASSVWG